MNRNLSTTVKQSMVYRLFTAFIGIFIIVLAGYTIFSVFRERNELKENLIREGEMLTRLLANYSRVEVFAENTDSLKTAAEYITSQKNVVNVSIYNAELKPLYLFNKMHSEQQDRADIYLRKMASDRFISSQSLEIIETRNAFSFLKPVVIETFSGTEDLFFFDGKKSEKSEEIIGYIRIVLDKSSYHAEMRSILLNNVVIAFMFILSSTVVIYLALKKITRPLARLTEHVRLFGTGKYVEKAPVESADEIGRLAVTFNTMVENLQKREKELIQAQKMESVGRLSRGIAHDFNNILTTVQGSVYILKKNLEENSLYAPYIEQINNSLSKLRTLIKGLLTFSRTQSIHLRPVDINMLIKKLKPMLKSLAGDAVDLNIDLSEKTLMVMANPLQIEQVIMNLCTNARDAMPGGGDLTIKTVPVNIDEEYAAMHSGIKKGDYMLLSVSDTGAGIQEEIKEKIFEPFFTTKESGRGIGLGLSIVFGIIQQHMGHIDFDTETGRGTVFKIYLPLQGNIDDNDDNTENNPDTGKGGNSL